MPELCKGRYTAELAKAQHDIDAALALRALCFRGAAGGADDDAFDPACQHMIVKDTHTGQIVCTFRLLALSNGDQISRSYAAQFYELSALRAFQGPLVEMGRFCIHPDVTDPDVLRMAWAAMTAYVDAEGVEMLFGCSSFKGTQAEAYVDAFALLKDKHLAPKRFLPRVKAPKVFRFAQKLRVRKPDLKRAMLGMPPLLRTYLLMGGWVSDHAVVDHDLDTLHVFTGLEIRAVPASRARMLRSLVG